MKKRNKIYQNFLVCWLIVFAFFLFATPLAISDTKPIVKSLPKSTKAPIKVEIKGITTDNIILSINRLREERGITLLTEHPVLVQGATNRAKYLFENNQWSHANFKSQFWSYDIPGHCGAENLARRLIGEGSEWIIPAWVNSPTHAKMMFNTKYNYAGVGYFENYTVLWLAGCR